ncbi:HD domain-containing protein [Desulfocurvus sp.]|jgi:putative hydrolase of HD superfamily|uniref:HD domain-containing protein n=1 Tax=Desulfocurvus sp. TaxID=2871698 RepID=UPI0025BAD73A|nr:HD domain-containing protein [Desulfocurvus sp.]MCK9240449.1 HD domain-containing protein [Desulfocurvus sp.]
MPLESERIEGQIAFIETLDALKGIQRRNLVMDGSRRENSAEHSWHTALMAVVLAEYAGAPVDVARVVTMLLLHDVVEIDAGDTFCYDEAANGHKAERERAAAGRIFGLLPPEQAAPLRALWEEFEAGQTPEARFANSLDRFQVLFQNRNTQGGTWRLHDISRPQVERRMAPIRQGMPALWPVVQAVLDDACASGDLKP